MPNDYYERQSQMDPGGLADGLAIEQEFDSISRAFGKLPKPHRDGSGFEGPTKVGEPVNEDDAVNLGSLEKLNLPIYRKKITTENWNDITTPGLYDVVDASGNDKPPCHAYGVLNVYSFNGVINQIYYPDVSDVCVLAKRACQNISQGTWQAWSLLSKKDLNAKTTCLVNEIGTGAPHETVSAALPPTITKNSSYTLENPFGVNTPVDCVAEIFVNDRWSRVDGVYNQPNGLGTGAFYVQGVGIILQTGSYAMMIGSKLSLSGHGWTGGDVINPVPCRVFVSRKDY